MEKVIDSFNLDLIKQNQLSTYYNFLVSENEKYNLTNITDLNEVYIKHFYDSIMMGKFVDLNNNSLLDVGSGAGFPSIPLKIMYPNLKVTIIEPNNKRVNFLNQLCEKLDLKDVLIICARAEDVARDYREKFDIATARAVSNLSMLLELTIPFLKVKGRLIAYKGANYLTELSQAQNAMKVLNCQVEKINEYELLNDLGFRSLIDIKKISKTNVKYPRRFSEIKKKPL